MEHERGTRNVELGTLMPAAIAAVPAPSAPVAFKPATIETGSGEAWGSTVVSAAP